MFSSRPAFAYSLTIALHEHTVLAEFCQKVCETMINAGLCKERTDVDFFLDNTPDKMRFLNYKL